MIFTATFNDLHVNLEHSKCIDYRENFQYFKSLSLYGLLRQHTPNSSLIVINITHAL